MRRPALAALLALACALPADARRIELPVDPVIQLDCETHVSARLESVGGAGPFARASGTGFDLRLDAPDGAPDGRLGLVDLVLPRVCAVRGLSEGAGFAVEVRRIKSPWLRNAATGARIRVRDVDARAATGTWAESFSIPQSSVRLDRAVPVDVRLRLDLERAQAGGLYVSQGKGVFEIEVTMP